MAKLFYGACGNAARRAKNLDSVIIATDDMRIAEAAFNWGAEVALTSTSHASGTDRIAEVARKAKQFAFIVNIQGDEPLIDPRLIDKLVDKLRSDRAIQIVTAAHPFEYPEEALSPHQVKVVVDHAGNALYFSRTPIPFHEKGSLLVPSPSGNLWFSAQRTSAVCEVETHAAGTRGVARAIARIRKWCKGSCAHHSEGISRA